MQGSMKNSFHILKREGPIHEPRPQHESTGHLHLRMQEYHFQMVANKGIVRQHTAEVLQLEWQVPAVAVAPYDLV